MDTGRLDMLRLLTYAYVCAYETTKKIHRFPVIGSASVGFPFGFGHDAAINYMNETKRKRVEVLLYPYID